MSTETPDIKPMVFYDGGCALCRREIGHYRRLDKQQRVKWVDITTDNALLTQHNIEPDQAMKLFHVLDRQQQLRIGAAAFVALWHELPGYRWLARLVTACRMTPLLHLFYIRFAAWRYRARSCNSDACSRP